jgi:hypothetical protein
VISRRGIVTAICPAARQFLDEPDYLPFSDAGEKAADSCQFFRLSFYIGAKRLAEIEDRTEYQQGTSKFIDWR